LRRRHVIFPLESGAEIADMSEAEAVADLLERQVGRAQQARRLLELDGGDMAAQRAAGCLTEPVAQRTAGEAEQSAHVRDAWIALPNAVKMRIDPLQLGFGEPVAIFARWRVGKMANDVHDHGVHGALDEGATHQPRRQRLLAQSTQPFADQPAPHIQSAAQHGGRPSVDHVANDIFEAVAFEHAQNNPRRRFRHGDL